MNYTLSGVHEGIVFLVRDDLAVVFPRLYSAKLPMSSHKLDHAQSTAALQAILELSSDVILILDGNGIVIACSPALERVFGYATTELEGKSLSYLMSFPFNEDYENRFSNAQSGVRKVEQDVVARKKDGTTFAMSATSVKVCDDSSRYVVVLRESDFTGQNRD